MDWGKPFIIMEIEIKECLEVMGFIQVKRWKMEFSILVSLIRDNLRMEC